MTDFATLVLATDTTGLRDGSAELRRLTGAGENAERATGQSTTAMGNYWTRLASVAGAALASIGFGAFISSITREAEMFETTMFRIEAVIRATGGAAGRSAEQLRAQARDIALGTLESTEGVLRAQQTMLTFRNVQGEVFDRAINASADLSAAMGQDMNSAAMQLARALEDPIRGVTALTRSGTVFTEAQRDMIREMVEAGNVAGAQSFILSELEAQYGGTARAAAQGLAGAQDTLGQRMQELRLEIDAQFRISEMATAAYNRMAGVIETLTGYVDDARGYFIAAALGITAYYTPALIGAVFQTGLWIASLFTLRGALIATGIGAFIVAVGSAINFLLQVREGTESWGDALTLLLDVARGVWSGIVESAGGIPLAMNSVWDGVLGGFQRLVAQMSDLWANFLEYLGSSLGGIETPFGSVNFGDMLNFDDAIQGARGFAQGQRDNSLMSDWRSERGMMLAGQRLAAGADTARQAMQALRDALASVDAPSDDVQAALDAINAELERTPSTAGGAGGAFDDLTESTRAAEAAAQSWADTMAGHFDGIITGGRNASDVLMSMARQLESSLWRDLFAGLSSGGGGFFQNLFAGFFDAGGMIPAGQFGIAGERGPEIITGPARVISRQDTAGMMRGGEPVQVVVSLQPSGEFDARVAQTAGAVVEVEGPNMVRGEVAGGGLDRPMGARFGAKVSRVRR